MGSFRIQGGIEMTGEVIPRGKNDLLQVISAVLLTRSGRDKQRAGHTGRQYPHRDTFFRPRGKVKSPGTFVFQADQVDVDYIRTEGKQLARRLRSIMSLRPLLARFGGVHSQTRRDKDRPPGSGYAFRRIHRSGCEVRLRPR